jgi:hypothetical protein
MKKLILLLLCVLVGVVTVGCADPSPDTLVLSFSDKILPSEVKLEALENLGYELKPVDGDNTLYKNHNQLEGTTEIQFVYRKPMETGGYSSISVMLQLLNPYLKVHDELIEQVYAENIIEMDAMIEESDAIVKQEVEDGLIDLIVEDASLYVRTESRYIVIIESSEVPDDEREEITKATLDYVNAYTSDYTNRIDVLNEKDCNCE